jgi:hypothetical protein
MESICEECGARYAEGADSCARRFNLLLALDHSRKEPWGSRHGLAFAVFALQHPTRFPDATRPLSFELLTRVVENGERTDQVVQDVRERGATVVALDVPPVPRRLPFPVTIADLGEFDASTYAVDLDRWCLATVVHLRAEAGPG